MTDVLIGLLICVITAAASIYAAHYIVQLRHNRDMLADELKRATEHISELESRVMLLEAERDARDARVGDLRREEAHGWETINIRA